MSDARTFLGEMVAAEEMEEAINPTMSILSRADNIALCWKMYPPKETVPENMDDGHQDEAPEPGTQFGRAILRTTCEGVGIAEGVEDIIPGGCVDGHWWMVAVTSQVAFIGPRLAAKIVQIMDSSELSVNDARVLARWRNCPLNWQILSM